MSVRLSKLEAVNLLLREINRRPVTALDTGGQSDAGLAERQIDSFDLKVQAQGWHWNRETDVTLNFASVELTVTIGGSDTLSTGEKVTQATTGATGYVAGDYTSADSTVLICPEADSEDWSGTDDFTGATNSATVTPSAVATETSGKIAVPDDVLTIDTTGDSAGRDVVRRGNLLFDRDDNTYIFDDSLDCVLVRKLDFADLESVYQHVIVAEAARAFRRETIGDTAGDRRLAEQANNAWSQAYIQDGDSVDANFFDNEFSRSIGGDRKNTRHFRG